MDATESPLGVLIVAFQREIAGSVPCLVSQSSIARKKPARCNRAGLLSHVRRILIPHHTTASAITMLVAVKAFSKADEAIAMLSFAYPDEIST